MVRISDLVRGSAGATGVNRDSTGDGMKLGSLDQFLHGDKHQPKEAPILEKASVDTLQNPPAESARQTQAEPLKLFLQAQDYLRGVKEKLMVRQPLPLEEAVVIVERMIANPSLVEEMYQLTLNYGHDDDPDIASSVNSMIYCFKIGKRMGYSSQNLMEICLAALHHDIGMFLIPDAIIKKEGKLSVDELAIIRKHTEAAKELMKPYDAKYPNVSRAVFEHHERESGKGYPLGLKGNEISEYAKIIGICDSYEAMTHDRPHKKAAAQYLSVLQLASAKDQLFAPPIMKVFLDEITLYPIGSYVRLNNKAIGMVVQTNPKNPFKPTIRILADGQGNKPAKELLINLMDDNILNIAAGITADEVPH